MPILAFRLKFLRFLTYKTSITLLTFSMSWKERELNPTAKLSISNDICLHLYKNLCVCSCIPTIFSTFTAVNGNSPWEIASAKLERTNSHRRLFQGSCGKQILVGNSFSGVAGTNFPREVTSAELRQTISRGKRLQRICGKEFPTGNGHSEN